MPSQHAVVAGVSHVKVIGRGAAVVDRDSLGAIHAVGLSDVDAMGVEIALSQHTIGDGVVRRRQACASSIQRHRPT